MPYDFDMSDVSLNGKRPVLIWGAEDDVLVPRAHREWLHKNIPGSVYRSRSGPAGHFHLIYDGVEAATELFKL